MGFRTTWTAAVTAAYLVALARCDCESYGVDFHSGGAYFQNSLSTDPFTALQEFEGCQNDTAHNVFVDPNGDQSECSETPLLPDDTPQLITCPQWPKDQLFSGEWSLLIISNNGDGDPIAYQRDFSLSVGPQQTVTAPVPTVTATSTIIPRPIATWITSGFFELTQTRKLLQTERTTTVMPATCSVTATSSMKDPLATVLPSILGELDAIASKVINGGRKRSEPTPLPALAKFKRALINGEVPDMDTKAAFVAARKASLQKLAKRAPDAPTITSTPAPAYVTTSVTAVRTTVTSTFWLPFWITTSTQSSTTTFTSTIKTTPTGAVASCSGIGGILN